MTKVTIVVETSDDVHTYEFHDAESTSIDFYYDSLTVKTSNGDVVMNQKFADVSFNLRAREDEDGLIYRLTRQSDQEGV